MTVIRKLTRAGLIVFIAVVLFPAFDQELGGLPTVSLGYAAQNTWVNIGGPIKNSQSVYVEVDASRHARAPVLASGKSGIFLAWTEINSRGISQIHFGEWGGKRWTMDASSLNRDQDHRAYDLSISMAGGNPVLAWVEWDRMNHPLIYTKQREKGEWISSEGPLNLDPLNQAANPVIVGSNSTGPVLVWSERDHKRVFQLHVKQFSDSGWHSLGQKSLNQNPSRDGIEPTLTLNGNTPYIAWMEPSKNNVFQVYVKAWTGESWDLLGSSLNISRNNPALKPSIAVFDNKPVVAWNEINSSGVSTLHVKIWTGQTWKLLGSTLNIDPSRHSVSPGLKSTGKNLYLTWGEYNDASHSRVFIKRWNGEQWEPLTSPLDASGNNLSVSPSIAASDMGLYVSWKEINSDGFFQILVKYQKTN